MNISPAEWGEEPSWVVPGVTPRMNAARDLAAHRAGDPPHHHTGVDLIAPAGTLLVASEGGVLVFSQGWRGDGTAGLWLRTDSGVDLLYGGVEPDSWFALGLAIGDRVVRGQPLARVGTYPNEGTMAHFEAWDNFRQRLATQRDGDALVWPWGADPPEGLLDPRPYLARAQGNGHVVDGVVISDEEAEPVRGKPREPHPVAPAGGGGGLVALAMLAGLAAWSASDG